MNGMIDLIFYNKKFKYAPSNGGGGGVKNKLEMILVLKIFVKKNGN
jgi:hypothetical protein